MSKNMQNPIFIVLSSQNFNNNKSHVKRKCWPSQVKAMSYINFYNFKIMSKSTTKVRRVSSRAPRLLAGISLAFVFALSASIMLSSCNVTRTITNESQYYQRGDTAVLIQTKTIETYDASKKL